MSYIAFMIISEGNPAFLNPASRPPDLCRCGRLAVFLFWIWGMLFIHSRAAAEKKFDFNPRCQEAYHEIILLRTAKGQAILNMEKKEDPDNLVPALLENYIDFFTLFFNEDPAEYARLKINLSKRLELMDQGPRNSPYFLYSRAVLHFQWAAIKIKFSYNWDAGWEFRKSFLETTQTLKSFPGFPPARMLQGAMQVAAGTIPDGYRWLSNLLGIRGTIQEGMSSLDGFLHGSDPISLLFHDEAVFYYLYLKFYIENRKADVFTYIREHHLDTSENLLFAYMVTNLSINGQQSAMAERIIRTRPAGADYLAMPVWDMQMGIARLNHLEPDAEVYLEKFLEEFKGKFYVKDVLQRLSWYYYLEHNRTKASACRKKLLADGSADTEADRQALKEARTGKWPDTLLLKARLLNDGGYGREALALLQGKSSSDFSTEEDKLEFAYRLGRIYDDLGMTDQAMGAYLTTLKLGQQRKEYYAARAALQAGYICERKGDRQMAIAYFDKVISLKDHDYKNSLDQKAKAGIQRCTGN